MVDNSKPLIVELQLPLLDSDRHLPVRIDMHLPPVLARKFDRLHQGLRKTHATFPGPLDDHQHVDTAPDVIRWLISQLPE